ncbi:MAG TPA: hypothetical protein VGN13_06625 [Solirubrobacteraceae bacterium]|jgi:hypothetical protein
MLRRIAIILLSALAGALLAGCGKGQHVPARAGTATRTSSAPGGVSPPTLTRAQALAFAHAVNLTAADVPGLHAVAKREHHSASGRQAELTLARCVGLSGSGQVAEAASPNFVRAVGIAHFDVSSNVTVSQSAALAAHELAQLRAVRAKGCLKRYLAVLLNSSLSNATVGPVSVQEGTPPTAGAGGSLGLRISTSITVRSIPIPFYLDILGFVSGASQVSLMSTGVPVPFPAATEQRLFLALLARAKAHHP